MKIIILKDRVANNSSFFLSGKKMLAAGVLLLAVPMVVGAMSYWLSAVADRSINHFSDIEYRVSVESRVHEQQAEIHKTRDYVRKHMDVLGRRIGSLQAQVSRINAVEQRIADSSGIDLNDFIFGTEPPIGGAPLSDDVDSQEVDIVNAIVEIEKELAQRESEIAAVDFLISRKNLESQQTPTGWPVKGGWVSSSFGSRMHPMTGKKQFHRGVDIPGKEGAQVLAVAKGVVIRSEKSGNYGWLVEIDHGDNYTTLYSHNKRNLVQQGETILKGQAIAEIGSTGQSTGPHVHFEVSKNKRNINPVKYLYKKS